jgi:hypothetical protein
MQLSYLLKIFRNNELKLASYSECPSSKFLSISVHFVSIFYPSNLRFQLSCFKFRLCTKHFREFPFRAAFTS